MRGCAVVDHSKVELLACPFCGRPAGVAGKRATRFPGARKVACSNDGCGAHFSYWHPDEWNRRATRLAQTKLSEDGLEAAMQKAFDVGGLEDGSYHLEADELEQVIRDALAAKGGE